VLQHAPASGSRRGFTLIELLVVVLVIGILATLLMPRYRTSVLKAQGADVTTRVEAINVALKVYEADHQSLPTETSSAGSAPAWLLPYLTADHFVGPGDVTFQYVKSSPYTRATLVIAAGDMEERQILLAAAGALGASATLIGGGQSLIVTLSE